jgi:hypothetical protein
MGLPSEPIILNIEQVGELNRKLAAMRHDINNQLANIIAAVEVIRHKPELAERMIATLAEQPAKIIHSISVFSAEFERAIGIKKP